MTDNPEQCYFKDKIVVENGIERVETNYHIVDGMTSTYINYELRNGDGVSAEISGIPRFEICRGSQYCPVFITNAGNESFEIKVGLIFELVPDEVLAIFPEELAGEIKEKHDAYISEIPISDRTLNQVEINKLLTGKV
jgi:hypothetical protein